MRSTIVSDDLTTRARIRDSALALFPEHGFAATTIRAVARDAGVSPGLVVHHFGSKEGLREDCDRHVVARFRETKLAAMEDENVTSVGFAAASYMVAGPLLRYFSWALVRGHPAAGELFDEMVREGLEITRVAIDKGMVKDSKDLVTRTTVHMALMFGMMAFHDHIERNTGIDPLTSEGIARLTPSLLEIFSGLFEGDFLETLRGTYEKASARLESTAR